jgi:hypothetical protein
VARSAAARKGWETRRANAAAAKKLAEYRKRSAAAKKGWETRRAKEAKKRILSSFPTPGAAVSAVKKGTMVVMDSVEAWYGFYDAYDGDWDEVDYEATEEYTEG